MLQTTARSYLVWVVQEKFMTENVRLIQIKEKAVYQPSIGFSCCVYRDIQMFFNSSATIGLNCSAKCSSQVRHFRAVQVI